MLSIYGGSRQPISDGQKVSLKITRDGAQNPTFAERKGSAITIRVPFEDGPNDYFSIVVTAKGFQQSGARIHVKGGVVNRVSVVLLKDPEEMKFLTWENFSKAYKDKAAFLSGMSPDIPTDYKTLVDKNPKALACLLNIVTAMSKIELAKVTPLDYFRKITWDPTMQGDRFFGYVSPDLKTAVVKAAEAGEFEEEPGCDKYHPGATCSYKQVAFPVANVQLTFHENDTVEIEGEKCIKIECDIDDFRNKLQHAFLEVIPNWVTGGKTNPTGVLALRWTLAQGAPAFDPGYSLA